jgi:predicted dehydrogenase
MKKIRAGVVGIGFIGAVHVEALKRVAQAEVVAICDSSPGAEAKVEQLGGISKWYASYDDMVKDPDIDSIHICTPNSMHFEQVKKALLAGKHVVCEKPLTTTVEEADELIRIAAEKGLVHSTNFNMRFYPLIFELRSMIASQELGEIYSINGSYEQDWLFYDTDYSWRLETALSGSSRAVADIGSHWLDMMEFVTGEQVDAVMADFATFHKTRKKPLKDVETYSGKILKADEYEEVPINTEDYANILLRFKGNAKGALTVSQVFAGKKNCLMFEIAGSKKSAVWNSERPNEIWIGRRDSANQIIMKDPSLMSESVRRLISYPGGHNEGFADTFKQSFTKVYQAIASGSVEPKPEYATFEAGKREALLCEKIIASSKSDSWVKI